MSASSSSSSFYTTKGKQLALKCVRKTFPRNSSREPARVVQQFSPLLSSAAAASSLTYAYAIFLRLRLHLGQVKSRRPHTHTHTQLNQRPTHNLVRESRVERTRNTLTGNQLVVVVVVSVSTAGQLTHQLRSWELG